jgi:Ca2+-binding EF-hand superfamily protein
MKQPSVIALAIAAAFAAPLAFAQDHGQDVPPVQSQAGVHAQAHSAAATRATFAEIDTDHDGRISIDEAGDDETLASGFVDLDADNDGYVTDAEYRAGMKAEMPHGATDDDGDVDEPDGD